MFCPFRTCPSTAISGSLENLKEAMHSSHCGGIAMGIQINPYYKKGAGTEQGTSPGFFDAR